MGDDRKREDGQASTAGAPPKPLAAPEPMEQGSPAVEQPLLLGRPPQAREPERPAIGESSSQPPAGATGPHANPIAPGERSAPAPTLRPGEVIPPRRAPDMPATGAARGPHPPEPGAGERRLAQQDWERWRAADRRKVPYEYPHWRT